MKNKRAAAVLSLAFLLGFHDLGAAGGFQSLALDLSKAARSTGVERLAVLPFIPADGSKTREGWNIAEKLTTQIVRTGKVQVVERSLLPAVMDEQKLAQTGAIDSTTRRRIGRLLAGGVIVTGSFVTRGREVVVNARLIDIETGVILGAAERSAERDESDMFAADSAAAFWVAVPELNVPAPAFPKDDMEDVRDTPSDTFCDGAAERVDRLETLILDLKARYWAIRLKNGTSLADIKVNPGSTITDPILKKNFYARMQYWYEVNSIPPLTATEVKRFITHDGEAYSIYSQCGV